VLEGLDLCQGGRLAHAMSQTILFAFEA